MIPVALEKVVEEEGLSAASYPIDDIDFARLRGEANIFSMDDFFYFIEDKIFVGYDDIFELFCAHHNSFLLLRTVYTIFVLISRIKAYS
jgi:hypothetical protein